jgi:hypothetical protein
MPYRAGRNWFDRHFRMLYFVALVAAVAGIGIAASASITNGRQDARNDAVTQRLFDCFDKYAERTSASSKAVREATADRDEATLARDEAFSALFAFIVSDPAEDDPRGLELFTALSTANANLTRAQGELVKARQLNPVPAPPSSFCND